MKLIYSAAILVFTCTLLSCSSTGKKISDGDTTVTEAKTDKKMTDFDYQEQGFLKGIVHSGDKAGDCNFVVEILGGIVAQKVDPVNMPESMLKDKQLVWIKFGGLKQARRCSEAEPVTIKDIKERAK